MNNLVFSHETILLSSRQPWRTVKDWYLKTSKIIPIIAGSSDKKNAISWVPQDMLVDQPPHTVNIFIIFIGFEVMKWTIPEGIASFSANRSTNIKALPSALS